MMESRPSPSPAGSGDLNVSSSLALRRRIFIVDDHDLTRMGMAQLILAQPGWEVCGDASDPAMAFRMIQELVPDIAIVDLRLKLGDGLELVKEIRNSVPSVRILVLSMQEEDLFAERSLRAGAMGYVNKDEPIPTLLSAIQRVAEGKVYVSPAMTDRLLSRQTGGRAGEDPSPLALLSDRELQVFERLGRGMSAKQIAFDLHLSSKTVEYHRQHIKEKLRVPTSSAVVRLATAHTLGTSPPS